ncbi:MAG: histidine kinase [Bacteroidota bacterium]
MTRLSPPVSYWTLHLWGWAAFGLAWGIGFVGEIPWDVIVVRAAPLAVLGALVTAAMRVVYDRVQAWSLTSVLMVVVGAGVSYVGSAVWTMAYYGHLHTVAPVILSAIRDQPMPPLRDGRILDGTVLRWTITLGWSALYAGFQYHVALQDERVRAIQAEAHAHQARLQALRYQLNPHFLFNALNGVSTLVTEVRTREATDMLAQLSDFLRLTLEAEDTAEVPLAEEIDFTRRYLDIEQARFGDRLQVHYAVDAEALSVPVPALVLQPLVENAVKYAVAPREEGGQINVTAEVDHSVLLVTVADNGPGAPLGGHVEGPDGADGGLGVGLANVRARLHERYGDEAQMEAGLAGTGGFRVRLRLPLRHSVVAESSASLPP